MKIDPINRRAAGLIAITFDGKKTPQEKIRANIALLREHRDTGNTSPSAAMRVVRTIANLEDQL